MAKILRRFRIDALHNSGAMTYFKYAISEIVLVTAGILIALSINNWNSNRKIDIRTNEILSLIADDMRNDLRDVDMLRTTIESRIDGFSQFVIGKAQAAQMLEDHSIFLLTGFPDWTPDHRGYDMLKLHSNGNPNDTLVNQVIHMSTLYLPYIKTYTNQLGAELTDIHRVMAKYPWYSDIFDDDELSLETVQSICDAKDVREISSIYYLTVRFELLNTEFDFEAEMLKLLPLIEERLQANL